MGGDVGRTLQQAVLGFAQGAAEAKYTQHLETQDRQNKNTMRLGEMLASHGQLSGMSPEMLKPIEKVYGKAGMAQLMQLDQINSLRSQLRQGAEQTVRAPIQEEQTFEDPRLQGPVTPQGQMPMNAQMTERAPTNVEMFQRAQQMGPLGTYYMTGDVGAGGLSAQQATIAQNQIEEQRLARAQSLDEQKYAEGPSRKQTDRIFDLQSKLAADGVQNELLTPERIQELQQTGVPEGAYPYIVGNDVLLIQPPSKVSFRERTNEQLGMLGVKDPSKATEAQLTQAIKNIHAEDLAVAGASEKQKTEAAKNTPLVILDPKLAAQYRDKNTGRPMDPNFKLNDVMKSGSAAVRLTDKQSEDLDNSIKFYHDLKRLNEVNKRLFAPGGTLHGRDKNFLGRLKTTARAQYDKLMQNDPDLVLYSRIKGQMAQAFNRGLYGGVGTQTEPDRKFSMNMFPQEGGPDRLTDTPEVAGRLMNEMEQRLLTGMRLTLGNKNFVPESMEQTGDEQQPAGAPQQLQGEQPQDAQNDDATVERLFQESGGKYSRETIRGYIQEQRQKKNPEIGMEPTPGGKPVSEIIENSEDIDSPMDLAKTYLGKSEKKHAKVLSSFIKKSAGINIDPAKTAWCAAFMNSVLQAQGKPGSEGNQLMARSFAEYGEDATDNPTEGDIAVFWRGSPNSSQGHVGFFMGYTDDGKHIKVLGGNQSDEVSIKTYPASQLLSIRRPTEMA